MSEETEEDGASRQVALADASPRNEIAMRSMAGPVQLVPANHQQAIVFAQLMAKSGAAVPSMFRGEVGLCLGLTLDAMQCGFNPFALARSSYVVGGALSYESKVFVAALNASGRLRSRLKATYTGAVKGTHKVHTKNGEQEFPAGDLKCRIVGWLVGEDEASEWETPELGAITTKGSPLWRTDPRLQLWYYGARSWARVHAPEIMLGFRSPDEFEDVGEPVDLTPPPKKTLMQKVQEIRAAEALPAPADASVDAPAAAVENAPTEPAPAAAEVVEEPPPKKKRAEKKAAAAVVSIATKAEVSNEQLDHLTVLRDAVQSAPTRAALDAVLKEWMVSISHLSRDAQFDLQTEGSEIVARAKLNLRASVGSTQGKEENV